MKHKKNTPLPVPSKGWLSIKISLSYQHVEMDFTHPFNRFILSRTG